MKAKAKRFLIMAGGTGGHVFPGLAVANDLIEQGHEVFWMGTKTGIEAEVVASHGIDIRFIDISGVRGKGKKGLIKAPLQIIKAILQAKNIIKAIDPDCVLGMGGFVAGPGGIAAKILNIPLIIHEQNAIAGTTNKLLSWVADVILEGFPNTFKNNKKAKYVGNPVRKDLHNISHKGESEGDLHVLVLGGSLGAKAINDIIPEFIETVDITIDVWHQVGKRNIEEMQEIYKKEIFEMKSIEVSAFIDDMAEAYSWADIVIARSGAMTTAELAVAGVPALLIPFPYAIDDHQTANAKFLQQAGAAELIDQKELTVSTLRHHLKRIDRRRELLGEMRAKATALGQHDATSNVVKTCVEVA